MGDDSFPMQKAIDLGRTMFPMGPIAPHPYPRPLFFRYVYPSDEVKHDIEAGQTYTVTSVEKGWKYTYHDVPCCVTTAGPLCDTADARIVTAEFIGEPETTETPAG